MKTSFTALRKAKTLFGLLPILFLIIEAPGAAASAAPMPRTFIAGDTVKVDTFHEYDICFPKDLEVRDCNAKIDERVLLDELGEQCDVLSVYVSEQQYRAAGEECYKIFRTYTVMNWCEYQEACGKPDPHAIVVNRDAPDFDGVPGEGVCVLIRDANRDFIPEVYYSEDRIPDPEERVYPEAFCKPFYYPAWRYTQVIKVYDDQRPVVQIPAAKTVPADAQTCRASLQIAFTATDNCSGPIQLESVKLAPGRGSNLADPSAYAPKWTWKDKVKTLGTGNYTVSLDSLPVGTYDLVVLVRDDCGNVSLPARIPFAVEDKKAPVPVCHKGLSLELMPDGQGGGMAAVWVSDLVASPAYDCNGQGPETEPGNPRQLLVKHYSINRLGEAVKPDQNGLTFTCADAGDTVWVELHAWDQLNNHDFCVTYVIVQDNQKACPPAIPATFSIAGHIATENGLACPGVEVSISGRMNAMSPTGDQGQYVFSRLEKGYDYSLKPVYDREPARGVSTRDLVILQKHLLGVELLDSPYKMIAADVNNSGYLSIADLIVLQQLILGKRADFSPLPSWRFVDAAYRFPNPANPWQEAFPESMALQNLQEDYPQASFVAIKMGDLNLSAMAPPLDNLRSVQPSFSVATPDRWLEAGQEALVTLFAGAGSVELEGFQFALRADPGKASLLAIEPALLTETQVNPDLESGTVTHAWVLPGGGASVKPGTELLTLRVRAKAAGYLSGMLDLDERRMAPEATFKGGISGNVAFEVKPVESNNTLRLSQNAPNPFSESTLIGFHLPEAGWVNLRIQDSQGRLLLQRAALLDAGEHQWSISAAQIKASGVLLYTLTTTNGSQTRRMVVLE